jgi:hypothetical protein
MFSPIIYFLLYPNTLEIDLDAFVIIPILDYLIEHYTVHVCAWKRYFANKFYVPYYSSFIRLFWLFIFYSNSFKSLFFKAIFLK